jgi:hypothetical protein
MRSAVFYIAGGIIIAALLVGAGVLVRPSRVGADANPGTNISSASGEFWAWGDVIGWMDFHFTHTITVSSQKLTGYASSSVGDISLDCQTTSIGDICGTSDYKVLNDGTGALSGWGWNDTYGWISFCGGQATSSCPGTVAYQVRINGATGVFENDGINYAWNDIVGWISFNCANYGGCGTSDYKVVTSWRSSSTSGYLDSSTFDTGVSGGAQINSIVWHGVQPSGSQVNFQIAASNSTSGPWSYLGSNGAGSYYSSLGSGVSIPLDYTFHNNQRYFRYRVTLVANQSNSLSPRVDDIVVHWSP